MFILEPIKPLKKMKITEEKKAFFYLLDNGFTEKEIDFIKTRGEKDRQKPCGSHVKVQVEDGRRLLRCPESRRRDRYRSPRLTKRW